MPTYSYRCTECDQAFDIQQAFTDDTLTVCPSCGGALRKVFSPIGISFTGSGFYRNDSRAKPDAGTGEAGAAGKPESSSTEKATTPEPKSQGSTDRSSAAASASPAKSPQKSGQKVKAASAVKPK